MNRVELTGRLTKDIELRQTPNGVSTTTFTLAVDRRTKEQQSADFIQCVAWRQSADYLSAYGRKGDWLEVTGRMQVRTYDQDGHRIYITEVVADEVHLVGGKKNAQNGSETATEDERSMEQWNTASKNLPW